MNERGLRRVGGAPFYAPPRRKTSAEIISEARAAVYGEMSSTSNGAGGALRPLRTRRPFTPREPQRTLFTERAPKKDTRPPSAFDLKFLSLNESQEDTLLDTSGARASTLDEETLNGILLTEPQATKKKSLRNSRSVQERSGDGWGGFPKLPHLSGRSKPLHRRNASGNSLSEETKAEYELAQAISITRPLGSHGGDANVGNVALSKQQSLDSSSGKKRQFASNKSVSCDATGGNVVNNIAVKHLAVQLPNTSGHDYHNMSMLELAEALSQRSRDSDHTVLLMEVLQNTLERNCPASSLRDLVLRSLYTHVDSEDERVLVAIARAMLTMRVTGNHLAAACKLVFKIARNDKNDHFFRNTNLLDLLVEGCGRADPLTEGECCVYGAGALRFLALDPKLCALAHRAGALHLAALHLKILNNAKAENPRGVSEQSVHALYQLTGALRNLAGAGQREVKSFVASGALAELVTALQHHTDRDVLTNVARCLSVLSAEDSCVSWLCASSDSAHALLRALAACAARAPLAVRLAYTLGNMAAADDQARINIYNEEGGVDVLLTILESYTNRSDVDFKDLDTDPDLNLVGSDLGGSDGSNEDVLIKTVRVVANLCLAERAGRGLADAYAERTVKGLLACLDVAEKPSDLALEKLSKEQLLSWRERREELAMASLATLNNITFYKEPPDPPDGLDDTYDLLCKVTCRWLVSGTGIAACEAIRALGNLSRTPRAAQLIVLEGALNALPPFLKHKDASVRCAAAGVLVNVCGAGVESSVCAELASRALVTAAEERDSPSAALLARALWNAHAHSPLSSGNAHQAASALTVFIGEPYERHQRELQNIFIHYETLGRRYDDSVFAACEATRGGGDRRASDPEISKHHVKFDLDNNNLSEKSEKHKPRPFVKAYSVDHNLHLDAYPDHRDPAIDNSGDEDGDRTGCSGEDLGFEEGDLITEEECDCGPCRKLAAWEELVGVAIPLLEQLMPPRADASVGTD